MFYVSHKATRVDLSSGWHYATFASRETLICIFPLLRRYQLPRLLTIALHVLNRMPLFLLIFCLLPGRIYFADIYIYYLYFPIVKQRLQTFRLSKYVDALSRSLLFSKAASTVTTITVFSVFSISRIWSVMKKISATEQFHDYTRRFRNFFTGGKKTTFSHTVLRPPPYAIISPASRNR